MQVKVVRLYVGSFFTSLDMQGASISLLPLDSARLAKLDSPTQAGFTHTSSTNVISFTLESMLAFSAVLCHRPLQLALSAFTPLPPPGPAISSPCQICAVY